MLTIVRSLPKNRKTGNSMAKTGGADKLPRWTPGDGHSSLLLSSTEFTATVRARRGGAFATARALPGGGWVLAAGDTVAVLGAKRGGQRVFVTLDAVVRAAARLGVDSVFVNVPKPDSRWVGQEGAQ